MPHYRSAIHNGGPYADQQGEILADEATATAHGARVVRELKRGTTSYLGWEMVVTEGERPVALLAFDEVQ
jgi:hypothetical protein